MVFEKRCYHDIQGNKWINRHAIEADLITNDDIFVVRNQLMDILKLTDWNDKEHSREILKNFLNP